MIKFIKNYLKDISQLKLWQIGFSIGASSLLNYFAFKNAEKVINQLHFKHIENMMHIDNTFIGNVLELLMISSFYFGLLGFFSYRKTKKKKMKHVSISMMLYPIIATIYNFVQYFLMNEKYSYFTNVKVMDVCTLIMALLLSFLYYTCVMPNEINIVEKEVVTTDKKIIKYPLEDDEINGLLSEFYRYEGLLEKAMQSDENKHQMKKMEERISVACDMFQKISVHNKEKAKDELREIISLYIEQMKNIQKQDDVQRLKELEKIKRLAEGERVNIYV